MSLEHLLLALYPSQRGNVTNQGQSSLRQPPKSTPIYATKGNVHRGSHLNSHLNSQPRAISIKTVTSILASIGSWEHGEVWVGKGVKVYWPEDHAWYEAQVVSRPNALKLL